MAARGSEAMLEAMLKNTTVDIDVIDEQTGVNAFWLAAFYGHGRVLASLASHKIDIMN